MPFIGKTQGGKSYRGKNGFCSAFTKVKTNEGYTWKKTSCTPRPKRKKKK